MSAGVPEDGVRDNVPSSGLYVAAVTLFYTEEEPNSVPYISVKSKPP